MTKVTCVTFEEAVTLALATAFHSQTSSESDSNDALRALLILLRGHEESRQYPQSKSGNGVLLSLTQTIGRLQPPH